MKVSIVTASMNSEKNISKCIESVNRQTYTNLEHVFVDGGSEDKTLSKIYQSKRPNVVISEPDNGIYHALNKGIDLASGELIIFLHSDDVFSDDDIIEKLVEPFFNDMSLVGVYGNIKFIKRSGSEVKVVRRWKSNRFESSSLDYGWMLPHTGLMVSKSVFVDIGKFDETFKIAGDYEFLLRFLSKYPNVHYLDVDITEMLIGGVSTAFQYNSLVQKFWEDVYALNLNNARYPVMTAFGKRMRKVEQYITRW